MQKIFNFNDKDSIWIDSVWKNICKKMYRSAARSCDKLPYTSINGTHDNKALTQIDWWTNGFWLGIMWLMYVGTKDDQFKTVAEKGEEMLDTALKSFHTLHHDVGFIWHISSGVNYRLTGNQKSKMRNMLAANLLAGRFNLRGSYLRAWNDGDWKGSDEMESNVGWSIVDSMMNIPLLYWASEESADPRFSYIAQAHADTILREHVRPDGSVRHIVIHDHINGGRISEKSGQGYAVNSAWSRGQAWALYGFIISYIHTKKEEYLNIAKVIAHYFISCVCDDWLPKCDFRSPANPIIYDSTAGACAACGLIEISNNVPELEKMPYLSAALNLLKKMEKKFCNWGDKEDCILTMGTESYHSEKGRHIPIIYGDYFFIEAIYKLKGFDILFW